MRDNYRHVSVLTQIAKFMGQHGAHLGPVGLRWAQCWPREPCYQGTVVYIKKETLMNDQLTDYLLAIRNKLLCAFPRKYSCRSLLIKTVDEWKTALDNSYVTGAVFYGPTQCLWLPPMWFVDCIAGVMLITSIIRLWASRRPGLGFFRPKPVSSGQNGKNWIKPVLSSFFHPKLSKTDQNWTKQWTVWSKWSFRSITCQQVKS